MLVAKTKEVKTMTEKEKQIIQTIADVLPKLSNEDKAYLLGFGEGLAASVIKPEPEQA